ncbi:MAG TPA: NTF2-like N-terminal transpeptidase domain-containing protein, partial [Chloroflexota bacterium]|nr:NTF2-like N-terminal transpeptidase domain-containing protein [Chloroflexota bacterium]
MSYRRRRQESGFPRFFLLLLIAGLALAGSYAFIPAVQRHAKSLLARASAQVPGPATKSTDPTNPDPRFVVAVPTMAPLGEVPSPEKPARDFLTAWQQGKYADMYALLSKQSQSSQNEKAFADWYTSLTAEASILKITPAITSVPMLPPDAGNGASVQVPFTATFDTIRVGSFQENNSVSLVLEDGQWRVDWRPSLFFHDLSPNDTVRLFPLNPRRGSIVDRKGRFLATMGFQETIGVIPGKLGTPQEEQQTLAVVSQYLKKSPADLQKIYAGQPKDWFIPLGDVDGSLEAELHQKFDPLPGVVLQRKPIRIYPQHDVAAHIVGYVGHITPDELKTMAVKGYTVDDYVGRNGVEQWADAQLSGQRGGIL